MDRKRIIIDCDAGIDDALALVILAAAHKVNKIEILAITCVNGNTNVVNVVHNVFRTLKACDIENIPVYKGAHSPLLTPANGKSDDAGHVHGSDGFGDVFEDKPDISNLQKEHAVHALYKTVCENPGEVSIICLGPLTNIALAIKLYPDFINNVKDFYVMGGNHTAVGNITAQAEFNFYVDPESVHIFFANNVKPLVLLPWEACLESQISSEWRASVFGKIQSPQVELLDAIEHTIYEVDKNSTVIYRPCDAILAGIIVRPDMALKVVKCHVDIELNGSRTRGQVVIDHLACRDPNTDLVTKFDWEIFKELLLFAADPIHYKGEILC
ncbi:inosine-uridine preferring nucleoside hydrolase-like isoform X2 [Athalia rosae]|uniref:inosine-uridine preferring nucleoside hydrolase-like isoform X2 n=1 Tax=Athalia rosae TaxID=37344 RepID=UPI002033A531|nr:inosine-uridine preferring nucleoside hydrolase-like isoform X2 [Athalia rosae]XP_020710244.2 inosine-uridine preferring nucleoside hydrolase-like isoform X2 [Athalia rosae]